MLLKVYEMPARAKQTKPSRAMWLLHLLIWMQIRILALCNRMKDEICDVIMMDHKEMASPYSAALDGWVTLQPGRTWQHLRV